MRLQNIARAAGIMSGHRRALSNLTYFILFYGYNSSMRALIG